MKKKIIVAVTGGIGSGKSTVAKMLQRLGAQVIDADRIAHQALRPKTAAYRQIVKVFGEGILKPNASIDPNASEDITHLTFMNTLDVFVSDDTKFQKDGFHQLYGDSKAFWTFEDLKACISNG